MKAIVKLNGREHYSLEEWDKGESTVDKMIKHILRKSKVTCKKRNITESGTIKVYNGSGDLVVDGNIIYNKNTDKCTIAANVKE